MHLFDYSEKTDKIVWSDFTYGESEIKQFMGGIHLEPFIATNGSVSWYLVTTHRCQINRINRGVVFLNPEKGRRCRSEISRGNASLGWLSNVLNLRAPRRKCQELRVIALNKKSRQAAAPSNVNMYVYIHNIYCICMCKHFSSL